MAEENVPNEGIRENPRRITKWHGDRQSTQERVQSNEHKHDPRTREMNGCTE